MALGIKNPIEKTDGTDRIEIISSMLSIIGKHNKFSSQKLADRVKLRHYRVETVNHLNTRGTIYQCINKKWNNWKEQQDIKAEKQRIESEQLQATIRKQSEQLISEWNDAKTDHQKAQWLTDENVKDTASMLLGCEDTEMFEGLKQCIPAFALKAALSTLEEQQLNKLCELGAERVPLNVYCDWNIIKDF